MDTTRPAPAPVRDASRLAARPPVGFFSPFKATVSSAPIGMEGAACLLMDDIVEFFNIPTCKICS